MMDLENIINPNRLHFGNKSKKLQSTKEMNIVLKSGARGTKKILLTNHASRKKE